MDAHCRTKIIFWSKIFLDRTFSRTKYFSLEQKIFGLNIFLSYFASKIAQPNPKLIWAELELIWTNSNPTRPGIVIFWHNYIYLIKRKLLVCNTRPKKRFHTNPSPSQPRMTTKNLCLPKLEQIENVTILRGTLIIYFQTKVFL